MSTKQANRKRIKVYTRSAEVQSLKNILNVSNFIHTCMQKHAMRHASACENRLITQRDGLLFYIYAVNTFQIKPETFGLRKIYMWLASIYMYNTPLNYDLKWFCERACKCNHFFPLQAACCSIHTGG